MADKLMYIPNDDTQNYPFCKLLKHLKTQLNESTNKNSMKANKVVENQRIRKRYCKTLGTSVIIKTAQCPLPPDLLLNSTSSLK